MIVNRSQRWRDRRDRYVPAASEIDPATLSVDVIDCMKTAKPWIEQNHYSGSFPASRLACSRTARAGGRALSARAPSPSRSTTHPFLSGPGSIAIDGRSTSDEIGRASGGERVEIS